MKRIVAVIAFAFAASGARHGSAPVTLTPSRQDTLSLDQARAYLIELTNRDRAANGLEPVALDPVATAAAQRHANEMAAYRYAAHYDLAGRLPDQRYTDAGGTDYTRENVYVTTRSGYEDDRSAALNVVASPTFSRNEIETMEAAYFNEVPPADGHRRNILAPEHNFVGIGLASGEHNGSTSLANDEEFIDRYVEVDPLPSKPAPGVVTVSGRALPGVHVYSVSVARAPLPAPMTRDELVRSRGYSSPRPYVTYWPGLEGATGEFQATDDGRFHVAVRLSQDGRPGLYYVTVHVWRGGRVFAASQRTVVVRQGPTASWPDNPARNPTDENGMPVFRGGARPWLARAARLEPVVVKLSALHGRGDDSAKNTQ